MDVHRIPRVRPSTRRASLACIVVLALTGCGSKGKAKAKAPPGVSCDTAASMYIGHHAATLNVGAKLPDFVASLAAICTKHQWADAVRTCLKGSTDAMSSEACFTDHAELIQVSDAIQLAKSDLAVRGELPAQPQPPSVEQPPAPPPPPGSGPGAPPSSVTPPAPPAPSAGAPSPTR